MTILAAKSDQNNPVHSSLADNSLSANSPNTVSNLSSHKQLSYSLPGAFPGLSMAVESSHVTVKENENDPIIAAVNEASWNILEKFSKVTRLYRNAAGRVLELPPIKPYVTPELLSIAGLNENLSSSTISILSEYEPARVYLAQWAHDLQVTRENELELERQEALQMQYNSDDEDTDSIEYISAAMASASIGSGSESETGKSVARSKSWWKSSAVRKRKKNGNKNVNSENSADEKQGEVVWDETVEAETGLGMFEVLSTDTTPPPIRPTRKPFVTRAEWESYFDLYIPFPNWGIEHEEAVPKGGRLVVDEKVIRKRVFEGGVVSEIRSEIWSFLLEIFPWDSDHAQRTLIIKLKTAEYNNCKSRWIETAEDLCKRKILFGINHYTMMEQEGISDAVDLTDIELSDFEELVRDAFTRIEKDVMRTDRSHPFYSEDLSDKKRTSFLPIGNSRLESLRDVLMTFASVHPCGAQELKGYVQGMSDLCSPLMVEGKHEAWAYAGFTFVMERLKANFLPDGSGMKSQLTLMRNLLQLADPGLQIHLDLCDSNNLFCIFRWFLVWFKREFAFHDTCMIWECCWAAEGYLFDKVTKQREMHPGVSPYSPVLMFHYFVALAILDDHRDSMVRHLMNFDEILKYVNDMSMKIPVDFTLAEAEIQFRNFQSHAEALGVLMKAENMEKEFEFIVNEMVALEKENTKKAMQKFQKKKSLRRLGLF